MVGENHQMSIGIYPNTSGLQIVVILYPPIRRAGLVQDLNGMLKRVQHDKGIDVILNLPA